MVPTMNIAQMAQTETSFRTTTPSSFFRKNIAAPIPSQDPPSHTVTIAIRQHGVIDPALTNVQRRKGIVLFGKSRFCDSSWQRSNNPSLQQQV